MNKLCFDIGANIGDWSLANINRYEKIVAIEASPLTFQKLQENCKHDRIEVLNYCVCNNGGQDITFYHADEDTLSTLNKEWLTNESSRYCNKKYTEINCKTILLDSLIKKYGEPDLIKVDVESGEYICLSSLTKKVPLLCFEWATETNHITFQCLDHLLKLGFTSFYIQWGDEYTFIPSDDEFIPIQHLVLILQKTTPKVHWGMIWAK